MYTYIKISRSAYIDGSTAFANPSFAQLPCPPNKQTGECIFISYLIFSEGAAPGEQGVVSFSKSN